MPHFDCAHKFTSGRGWNAADHRACQQCHPPHPGPIDGVAPEIVDAVWLLERSHLASLVESGIPAPADARRYLFGLIAGAVDTAIVVRAAAVLAREDLMQLADGGPPINTDLSEVITALAIRVQQLEATRGAP
jgi:hypothetical protein